MRPHYVVPPSSYIEEWLDDEGKNQSELAKLMGVSPKHVSKILSDVPITLDTARKLERVTGISLDFWVKAEAHYRHELNRRDEASQLEDAEIPLKSGVLADLRKRGLISSTQRKGQKGFLCQQLMTLLGVGTWQAFLNALTPKNDGAVAFRQGALQDSAAVSVWLRLGELELSELPELDPFQPESLHELIPGIRTLTVATPEHFGVRLVEMLNSVGVYLLYVKDLPGTGTFGATRWIKGHPVIQLSLRNKGDDMFWFTLFHEIGHVLLHQPDVFINIDGGEKTQHEAEADDFARQVLLPEEFSALLGPKLTLSDVQTVAQKAGIAPGIVVGRCHYEGYLPYHVGRQLIQSLKVVTADDGVGD